jgi:hypothetical protein
MKFKTNSFAGPVDSKALSDIEERHVLDPGYREFIFACHGGIPVEQYIKGKGQNYRLGRFLTILDQNSQLTEKFQPHFEYSDIDSRVARSVAFAINSESNTSRALFYGQRLLPFAAFYAGEHHPDDLCLDRAYVSMLCFDYKSQGTRPPVVVWHAHEALKAYFKWEEANCPFEGPDGNVPKVDYEDFTEHIADNFDEFLKLMQQKP